jgi:hypothetical protein
VRTALLGPTLFLTGQTATRWFADCSHSHWTGEPAAKCDLQPP